MDGGRRRARQSAGPRYVFALWWRFALCYGIQTVSATSGCYESWWRDESVVDSLSKNSFEVPSVCMISASRGGRSPRRASQTRVYRAVKQTDAYSTPESTNKGAEYS